jgi:hypothetical protein
MKKKPLQRNIEIENSLLNLNESDINFLLTRFRSPIIPDEKEQIIVEKDKTPSSIESIEQELDNIDF